LGSQYGAALVLLTAVVLAIVVAAWSGVLRAHVEGDEATSEESGSVDDWQDVHLLFNVSFVQALDPNVEWMRIEPVDNVDWPVRTRHGEELVVIMQGTNLTLEELHDMDWMDVRTQGTMTQDMVELLPVGMTGALTMAHVVASNTTFLYLGPVEAEDPSVRMVLDARTGVWYQNAADGFVRGVPMLPEFRPVRYQFNTISDDGSFNSFAWRTFLHVPHAEHTSTSASEGVGR